MRLKGQIKKMKAFFLFFSCFLFHILGEKLIQLLVKCFKVELKVVAVVALLTLVKVAVMLLLLSMYTTWIYMHTSTQEKKNA